MYDSVLCVEWREGDPYSKGQRMSESRFEGPSGWSVEIPDTGRVRRSRRRTQWMRTCRVLCVSYKIVKGLQRFDGMGKRVLHDFKRREGTGIPFGWYRRILGRSQVGLVSDNKVETRRSNGKGTNL